MTARLRLQVQSKSFGLVGFSRGIFWKLVYLTSHRSPEMKDNRVLPYLIAPFSSKSSPFSPLSPLNTPIVEHLYNIYISTKPMGGLFLTPGTSQVLEKEKKSKQKLEDLEKRIADRQRLIQAIKEEVKKIQDKKILKNELIRQNIKLGSHRSGIEAIGDMNLVIIGNPDFLKLNIEKLIMP